QLILSASPTDERESTWQRPQPDGAVLAAGDAFAAVRQECYADGRASTEQLKRVRRRAYDAVRVYPVDCGPAGWVAHAAAATASADVTTSLPYIEQNLTCARQGGRAYRSM